MPFIQTPNLRVHYRATGDGATTVLLLHGNFGSWRWWQPVLDSMPPGWRAFAPDLRGCGDTERPEYGHNIDTLAADVHAFVAALELAPVHVVGHSLGAAVSLQFALDHPQHVGSLTLVAPPPAEARSVVRNSDWLSHSVARLFDVSEEMSVVALGATYRLLRHLGANRPMLRRALMRLAPTLEYDNAFIELVSDAARMAPQAVVGHLQALDVWDVQVKLRSLAPPVLIVGGAQDVLIAPVDLTRFGRRLRRARVLIWPDVGHAVQLEQPQRFVTTMTAFIERSARPWWWRWMQALTP
ncbi:MAG: alpha/beta fold hydrolase [Acidiferrobacterales bacterium]